MAKQDEVNPQDVADYASAFNDDAGPGHAGDDDFGRMPGEDEGAEGDAGSSPAEERMEGEEAKPAAVVVAAAEPGKEGAKAGDKPAAEGDNAGAAAQAKGVTDENNAKAAAKAGAETTGSKEAAAAAGEHGKQGEGKDKYDLSDVPPEDMQKAKSWVGRLKKIEADLAAQKAPKPDADDQADGGKPTAASEALENAADATSNKDMASAMNDAAERIESGESTADQELQQLAEDFGQPFLNAIEKFATSAANKAVEAKIGAVSKSVDDVIGHITNEAQRKHFETIKGAHPDFADIHKSPEFAAHLAAHPDDARVAEQGSAEDINSMLARYKAARAQPAKTPPAQDQVDPAAADAAGGVKSRGMRLPERPGRAQGDDYEKAFNEF